MDVKELIKWLFQIKKSESTNFNSRAKFRMSHPSVLLTLIVINTMNTCYCYDLSSSVLSSNMTNNENESLLVVHEPLIKNINSHFKSEIKNLTKRKLHSFQIDENTREEFKAASGILKRIRDFDKFLDTKSEEYLGKSTARTFGRPIKKLQAMLIPLMFKLGVLSTIIVLTFLLALKAVAIGKILMMISSASLLATLSKIFLLKGSHGQGHDDLNKQVHLHIHNSGHNAASSGWSAPYGIPISSISQTGHDAWNRRVEPYSADNQNFIQQTSLGASVINTPFGRYVRTGAPTAAGFKR